MEGIATSSNATLRAGGKNPQGDQQAIEKVPARKAQNIGSKAYDFGGTSIIHEDEKPEGNLVHLNFFNSFVDDFDMRDVKVEKSQ